VDLGLMHGRTKPASITSTSARGLMNSGAPWVEYVNEVVLCDVKAVGISIDGDYRIDTGPHSTSEVVDLFKNTGWSWPRGWLRRNRNVAHHGGIHLENEVETARWIHLIIVPQLDAQSQNDGDIASAWNLSPFRVDLHVENRWLRPSSVAHFYDFITERYLLPFFKWLV
jgi:hypothetical protein